MHRDFRRLAYVIAAAGLAACAPDTDTDTGTEASGQTSAASEESAAPAASPLEAAGVGDAVFMLEGEALAGAMRRVEGLELSQTDAGVRISGMVQEARSTGRTGGAHVEIDSETAAEIGGRTVTVTIVARSESGGALQAAYSTNEIGNSGWRELPLGEAFEPHAFEYQVRAVENANEDYIGLIPMDGPVEIAAIAVSAGE